MNNVAPAVDAGAGGTIDEAGTFTGSGSFADPGADSWTATVDYGDGSGAQALALNPDKTFSLGHTYASPGIYTVTVTVTDDDTGEHSLTVATYVVVYDPEGGFVTGGGWILSPADACKLTSLCEGTTGKATFGFSTRRAPRPRRERRSSSTRPAT